MQNSNWTAEKIFDFLLLVDSNAQKMHLFDDSSMRGIFGIHRNLVFPYSFYGVANATSYPPMHNLRHIITVQIDQKF